MDHESPGTINQYPTTQFTNGERAKNYYTPGSSRAAAVSALLSRLRRESRGKIEYTLGKSGFTVLQLPHLETTYVVMNAGYTDCEFPPEG